MSQEATYFSTGNEVIKELPKSILLEHEIVFKIRNPYFTDRYPFGIVSSLKKKVIILVDSNIEFVVEFKYFNLCW